MAKRRKSRRKTSTSIVRAIQVPTRTAAPIIRVSAPRAAAAPRKSTKRRHSRRGSSHGHDNSIQSLVAHGVGGAGYGLLEKYFPNMPTLPILGRAGTVAVAAWLLRKHLPPIAKDVGKAAAVIAGYQLGSDGSIHGDVMGIPSQVRGIAAQV